MNYLNELTTELGQETKYLRWYISLITSRLSLNRVKIKGSYLESHHILPTCVFGPNDHTVNLTFREHYLAHLFLALHARMTKSKYVYKMIAPLWRMKGLKKNQYKNIDCRPFSRTYELVKKIYVQSVTGSGNPFYGKTHSEKTREKLRANRGWFQTNEAKLKISESLKGKFDDYQTFYHPITLKERRISPIELVNFINENSEFLPGLAPTEKRLKSYELISQRLLGIIRPKGEDSCHYGKITVFNTELKISKRVSIDELETFLNLGWEKGLLIDENAKLKANESRSKKMTGRKVDQELINKVNKNPEKIRKTAEANRGQKRSQETKDKISEKAKGRIVKQETRIKLSKLSKGRKSKKKGSTYYYDPNDCTKIFIIGPDETPNINWLKGHPKKMNKYAHLFKK